MGGWKVVNEAPTDLGNAVCIVAPHTAIEDFFVGLAFYWSYGIKFKVIATSVDVTTLNKDKHSIKIEDLKVSINSKISIDTDSKKDKK